MISCSFSGAFNSANDLLCLKQTNEAEAKHPGRSKLHRAARFAILTERWPGWPPLL